MKKNMLAVLVLIVSIVNLTLCAYMIFTVVPNAKRTDTLITKILQIIELELDSPLPVDMNITYDINDVETKVIDEMPCNLTQGEDGKTHYAMVNVSLLINSKDEDYETLSPKVDTFNSNIKGIIANTISEYTYEELSNGETNAIIKDRILTSIQSFFNSRFIVDCTVYYMCQ